MSRLASLLTLFVAMLLIQVAGVPCQGQLIRTGYYAPTTTYYAPAPATVYYAPAPATTYYAPAVTAYYAPTPTTVYYTATAPVYYGRPLVGAGITRVGYAPVTYVAPRATYYAPVRYTTAYSP